MAYGGVVRVRGGSLSASGAFEGVEGVIRRVKRCKRVVVEIEGVMSVAIAHVPVGLLKEMDC